MPTGGSWGVAGSPEELPQSQQSPGQARPSRDRLVPAMPRRLTSRSYIASLAVQCWDAALPVQSPRARHAGQACCPLACGRRWGKFEQERLVCPCLAACPLFERGWKAAAAGKHSAPQLRMEQGLFVERPQTPALHGFDTEDQLPSSAAGAISCPCKQRVRHSHHLQ